MTMTMRAPAKINLSLHITARRSDGYHELESLVAFAGAGDLLAFVPGETLSLRVSGPTAPAAGREDDNLVMRAARELAARVEGLRAGAFHLVKRLPVGAGIGGGSSDAAAALRLLALGNGLRFDDPRLFEAAGRVGADVPVCVQPRARFMRGIGERLGPPLSFVPLAAVLVNPGVHLDTREVFRQLGLRPGETCVEQGDARDLEGCAPSERLAALAEARNDMQDAARSIAPVIGDVLAVLARTPANRLVRMSGSGTTCFAIFDDCRAASRAARSIRRDHPSWWVKSTVLR